MKKFTSTKRATWQLEKDDWIRMGGQLYRVTNVDPAYMSPEKLSVTLIRETGDPELRYYLLVPRGARFKVYNQK